MVRIAGRLLWRYLRGNHRRCTGNDNSVLDLRFVEFYQRCRVHAWRKTVVLLEIVLGFYYTHINDRYSDLHDRHL